MSCARGLEGKIVYDCANLDKAILLLFVLAHVHHVIERLCVNKEDPKEVWLSACKFEMSEFL